MKIKEHFHKLIDEIKDEEMLSAYYDLIIYLKKQKSSNLYNKLTAQQKNELDLAYEESFDQNNLISHSEVVSQHKKWL